MNLCDMDIYRYIHTRLWYIYIHTYTCIYIYLLYTHYIVYFANHLVSVLFFGTAFPFSCAEVQMAALRAIAAIFYQLEEMAFHQGTPG